MADFESVKSTSDFIRSKVSLKPEVAIVCGSGLGDAIASDVKDQTILAFGEIPNFPVCTVVGHEGSFVFGKLGGKNVVVMKGRVHPYEGYPYNLIALPIRVMHTLGATHLLITNAAGGINPTYVPGTMVIIKDHIDFASMVGRNPLTGPNDERFGVRFPALINTYNDKLRQLAWQCAKSLNIEKHVREGVYWYSAGPPYETPAATRVVRQLGGDVEGMSTTSEAIVAQHLGMTIFAISLVTDLAVANADEAHVVNNHEEVVRMANLRGPTIASLLKAMLEKM